MALTEDLTQQAFVAAIAQRSSFLPSLPTSQRALLVFVVLDDLAVAGAACITDAGLVDEDRRAVSAPAR